MFILWQGIHIRIYDIVMLSHTPHTSLHLSPSVTSPTLRHKHVEQWQERTSQLAVQTGRLWGHELWCQ